MTERLNNSRKDLTSKHGSIWRLYRLRLKNAFSGGGGERQLSPEHAVWQFFTEGVVADVIYPSVSF